MASIPYLLFLSLLSHSILLSKCDVDADLLQGINKYRTSLNLTALNMTNVPECIADKIADMIKNQTCRNTTASNTTTLSNFPNYPTILTKCNLNTTNATQQSQILPACVPDQQPDLVLSNFTSKYATYLNSTQFSDIGIGSENNWIVVVLTNMTTGGVKNRAARLTTISPVMFSIICLFMLI